MASTRPEISSGSYPKVKPVNPFSRVIGSVLDAGREILARRGFGISLEGGGPDALIKACQQLLEHRGEASGLALASEITSAYRMLDEQGRENFFVGLARDFDVDEAEIMAAADRYKNSPDADSLASIVKAVEAPRQKLFRRINMAPDGTATLVAMRGQLIPLARSNPALAAVDSDMRHLFISWFNKGFLEMRRIDWGSPAMVLEKIIEYEAVHAINGWSDLRNRLAPDRLCYAFFHPAMPNDPLVFVEIALTQGVADKVGPLLAQPREMIDPQKMDTVIFYSISNCHPGLAGVSFGNFLLKHVVEEIHREIPAIKQFVTLSPVPGFTRWLRQQDLAELVDSRGQGVLEKILREEETAESTDKGEKLSPQTGLDAESATILLNLCAQYLYNTRRDGLAWDPVARFHLGNGASLHQLNWAADLSDKGVSQSLGIMVNYLYDLKKIEVNHDEYFDQSKISASKAIRKLL
ncbi:MAG: malonyl-CoA decarboxylase [Halieaceae bacterium]|jgi:malonyl-CoA decarboxylase